MGDGVSVVRGGPRPEAVVAALGPSPGTVWLDSGDGADGWSIVAFDPVDVLTDGAAWLRRTRRPPRSRDGEVPFTQGLIGYVGYGAGHRTAPVPPSAPTPEPEVWLGRFEGALCFRHHDATWHLTGDRANHQRFRELLAKARDLPPVGPAPEPTEDPRTVTQQTFEAAVAQILEWIQAGDCYQVNLSRPVHVGVDHPGDPGFDVYRRLRSYEAQYGAFLRLGPELDVLCNSPELLVEVVGRTVASEPIKGTRPRTGVVDDDRVHREALLSSTKDEAELTMIVDLVRNDLHRIAEPGSVRTGERRVMALPTVHHTYRRIEATLRRSVQPVDALAALFPPGSVTGAPKVRACQRIAELEATPRGVYCGAIGYLSDHGQAAFNVAIRTGVVHERTARYHVGGGVVASSEPRAEWTETEVKGRAWARALGLHSSSNSSNSSSSNSSSSNSSGSSRSSSSPS